MKRTKLMVWAGAEWSDLFLTALLAVFLVADQCGWIR